MARQGTGAKRTKAVGAPTAGGTPAARAAQQSPAGAIATGSGKLKQQRQQQLAAAAPQPQRKRQKQSASKAAAPRQPVATAEPASSDDDVELSDVELSDDSGEEALDVVPERQPVAAAPAANGATAKAAKRKRKAAAVTDGVADADADVDAAAPNALAAAGLETVPLSALRAANAANSAGAGAAAGGEAPFRNKEKVLLLTSRGIPPRHRHLMLDLGQLLPNAKRDSKLDTKSDRAVINEAAELKGCTSAMFFEARKRQDCYLWLAKVPAGPTAKFLIVNVHTMAELKLSGNHLKGSRPVLSFDQAFDSAPHWLVLKEVLTHVFATPKRHHKSKPFFDHVVSFSIADGRIWLRNYQVCQAAEKPRAGVDATSLVEVGPRACLNPILIFSGAFGGPVIWENPGYVSPNDLRAAEKRKAAGKYTGKVAKRQARRVHVMENSIPRGELDDVFRK